jgi:nuclear transport factor 2 (NTF2) superfamily protein
MKPISCRLKKHYFVHDDNKIAVTFQYEYQNSENGSGSEPTETNIGRSMNWGT